MITHVVTQGMRSIVFEVTDIINIVLCCVGFIMNITSLSYFIQYEHVGCSNKLMILLISVDLALCTIYPLKSEVFSESNHVMYKVLSIVIFMLISSSQAVTTMLSVTRTRSILNPFRRTRSIFVWCSLSAVILLQFALIVTFEILSDYHLESTCIFGGIFLVLVFVVTCSGIASLYVLRRNKIRRMDSSRGKERSNNVSAVITISILVLIFCVTNLWGWIMKILYFTVFAEESELDAGGYFHRIYLCYILNSVANPFVYVFRKSALRRYVRNKFCFTLCCCS